MDPVDDQSIFGYCENCGVVYVLKDRLGGSRGTEPPQGLGARLGLEPRETDMIGRSARAEDEAQLKPSVSHWRCPDCDAEISADSDSLEYVKREHIRDYHPNRSSS